MKFGKLIDISEVDFQLPPDDPRSLEVLGGNPSPKGPRVYVGLPRWASKDWLGKLYPKGTKQAEYLAFYSQSFNTIELNSTHYRIPNHEIVKKWKNLADEGFKFCPKIPQSISHYSKLMAQDQTLQFCEAIALFEDKMGCSFVQLHASFGPSLLGNLQLFLASWPQKLPLAIEFRHPDWFIHNQLIPEVYELLKGYRVAPVITDVSGRRDVLHTSLTNKIAMIRLVGNALHPTDFQRAKDWMKRLKQWVDQGLEEIYIFAHEPEDLLALEYGKFLIEQLNSSFNLGLAIPGLPGAQGAQMELF